MELDETPSLTPSLNSDDSEALVELRAFVNASKNKSDVKALRSDSVKAYREAEYCFAIREERCREPHIRAKKTLSSRVHWQIRHPEI